MLLVGCAVFTHASPMKVVATTSQLGVLAKEIGGSRVEPVVLIPAGSCPGHYELRPGDVKALMSGSGFVYHGWEGFAERLLHSANIVSARTCRIAISGSWLLPSIQIRAAETLCAFFCRLDGDHAVAYRKNLREFCRRMRLLEKELVAGKQRRWFVGVPVIVAEQQEGFLRFLGCDVVGVFPREESLTPADLHQLLSLGRARGVRVVVDNLQSGSHVGQQIATRLGVACVVLSNFPGAFPGTPTIETTVRENLRRLAD